MCCQVEYKLLSQHFIYSIHILYHISQSKANKNCLIYKFVLRLKYSVYHMHPVQVAIKQVREKKSWRKNEDWNLILLFISFPLFYIRMLEASLDKLPKHSCSSYFIPFFSLIFLFAAVNEFVTFRFWKILQYLNNITGFSCRITRNFHQSHKILVVISVT